MLRSLDRFEVEKRLLLGEISHISPHLPTSPQVEKRLLLGEICACEEATEARQLRPANLLG